MAAAAVSGAAPGAALARPVAAAAVGTGDAGGPGHRDGKAARALHVRADAVAAAAVRAAAGGEAAPLAVHRLLRRARGTGGGGAAGAGRPGDGRRSEEHTSELQSLMRISYAVFCLTKKK